MTISSQRKAIQFAFPFPNQPLEQPLVRRSERPTAINRWRDGRSEHAISQTYLRILVRRVIRLCGGRNIKIIFHQKYM